MQLTPHTRGDSPTKNKPQVFLFAAPEDTGEQKELISMLLDHDHGANLCVWSCGTLPKPEELPLLKDMSLFVLAVTERLAGKESAAAAQAIRFAYDSRIPVLPVYYISPNSSTEPAGSFFRAVNAAVLGKAGKLELDGPRHAAGDFPEQFERKLKALVISDETAEEVVRDAFRKQIFLSYRKKDREQALKVMKTIHDLPWCEALAIWFDDFLIAGQDFNSEIRKQLLASDAFALTVTPSLTEKDNTGRDNYVLREEWPRAADAKGENNRILVEAEEVGPDGLSGISPPMRGVVSVWDSEALKEAIERSCLLDGERKEPSARQKYLLGMAYLTGIRVEKDPDRALRLLREAAGEGEAEAALQLGFMYLARVGVERDNDEAVKWKTLAFDLAEKKALAGDENAVTTAYRAAFGSDGLVLMKSVSDQPEEARSVCRRMRAILEKLPEDRKNSTWLAVTYTTEGDIHFDNPDTLTAEELRRRRDCVMEGLRLQDSCLDTGDDSVYMLAMGYATLGEIDGRLGNIREEEDAFKQSLTMLQSLADKTDSHIYRRSLASVWGHLGLLYEHKPDIEKARKAFAEAMAIDEKCCAEMNLPNDWEGLAIACYNYGRVHEDYSEGVALLEKAVGLMEKVAEEDPQDVHVREELDAMRNGLRLQRKRPMLVKLIRAGIILLFAAALGGGLFILLQEILA